MIISLAVIRKRQLPFEFSRKFIRFNKNIILTEIRLGAPVALQELLVGISFLVIQTIVNTFGVAASAGVGVGYGVLTAFTVGVIMGILTFFHGDVMASIFSKDPAVIADAHSYLKAYAIDCMLTPFLFCFTGYYNGCEKTMFVMIQGIVGAFLVRIPVVYLVSRIPGATLFQIGLGTPASSLVQITLCLLMFVYLEKKSKKI